MTLDSHWMMIMSLNQVDKTDVIVFHLLTVFHGSDDENAGDDQQEGLAHSFPFPAVC